MRHSRKEGRDGREKEGGAFGLGSILLCVGGLIFAYAAVELAFKPLLKAGRKAMRKSLDPDYDVDDELDDSSNTNNSSSPRQPDEETGPQLKNYKSLESSSD